VSCDPSPTNNWAIEWWLYNEPSELRYLIDIYRGKLDAPDFLDFNHQTQSFTGIMEEWQATSVRLGRPITTWIVEVNAAQRFLLQYDHIQRWKRKWGVDVIPHTTGRNKSDENYGVETIAPHYRFGRVRLPGNDEAMPKTMKLIDEVTRWTKDGALRSDDCIMAHWFFEWQLPYIQRPNRQAVKMWRPSWIAS
jgi:hypothetical protein